jgi:thiol-disulfide isomerase/thioredoxin
MRYHYPVLLLATVVLSLWPSALKAAPPEEGQEYVVQADDGLSKLAEKFYGDKLAYSTIVEATNARAAADSDYTRIDDPAQLKIGQKLFIPAVEALVIIPPEEPVMSQEATTSSGPTPEQLQLLASLPSRGVPPELYNEVWLNSEPLKLAGLRGKVIIVEFWTFGCINCKNVLPSLREWHHEYADDGLVIIGVHTPEFSYEEKLENVRQALVDLDVPYPVAIDSDWATWQAYQKPFNQRYWPSKYFIDKAGNVRHIYIGEGYYDEQEVLIQALLAEEL